MSAYLQDRKAVMTATTQAPSNALAVPIRVYLILGIGVLAVSSAAILIRFSQADGMSSLLIAALRLSIATIALTPIVWQRYWRYIRQLHRTDILLAALSGIFLALHFVTWTSSLEYTSVLISVVLVTTSPLWAALLEVFILKDRLTRMIVAGLLIAITGGILISVGGASGEGALEGSNHALGATLSLIGALTVSIYLIIGRKLRSTMPLMPYIWIVYACSALTLVIWVAVTQTPVIGFPPTAYLACLLNALIPQLIGHTAFNYAVGYLPATFIGMSTQLEPIGSAIYAYFLFQEIPLPLQILGSAIVLIGVSIANYGQSRKQRQLLKRLS